ncbi:MAG: hypothetical protein D6736_13090 [Nitrospinota bacterium]|nr:MAG: hypothetical protein D6736_13090 [Nitrospinota bacterium]
MTGFSLITLPRIHLYVSLCSGFRPPEQIHIQDGAQNRLVTLVHEAAHALQIDALVQESTSLARYLETLATQDMATTLEALRVEYNRLFVGPASPLAHPYESVYRTPGGWVMGECTLEVLQMYREEGLYPDAGYKDLPDHISMELEYMACLCQREAEARERGEEEGVRLYGEKEHRFLKAHLASWIPQFCARVLEAASLPFYPHWARIAHAFIAWDTEYTQVNDRKGGKR